MRASRLRRAAVLFTSTVVISLIVGAMGLTLLSTQRADRRLQINIDVEN